MRPAMSDLRFEAGCNLQGKKRKKKNTWKERKKIVKDERD